MATDPNSEETETVRQDYLNELARVSALMDAVPDIMMEIGLDMKFTRSNQAGLEFFGEDCVGRNCTDYFVGDSELRDRVMPLFRGDVDVFNHQTLERRKDGAHRLLEWKCRLLRDCNHKPLGVLAGARDITDSNEHASALAASEALKGAIVESSIDGIISIDKKGSVVSFNRAAEKLFGYEAAEVIGKNVNLLMPEPYKQEHDQYIHNFLSTGRAKIIGHGREVTARRKDGSTFPFFLTVSPPVVVKEQAFFIGLVRDLTHEKQVEAQLRQAQKMESMGTLAGGIAHDFNNILGGVIGYAELMLEDAEEGSYLYDDLKELLNGCYRARDLVQQILTFSRQDKPKREPLFLFPIIKEALKLMRATIPSTIEFRREIDTNCDPVMADVTQIHQVIMNLCANAHYAMRDEPGVLGVKLVQLHIDEQFHEDKVELPFGEYVRLSISDTGMGIGAENLSRIFEPFFTTKSVGEGTGMGLSVVHGIVKNHGGDITVSSEPDKGATFNVYFPIHRENAPVIREVESDEAQGQGQILLVDDDQFLLKAQRRILDKHGYKVTVFADSELALQAFLRNPGHYDLVMTDQTMPRLTGLELARRMLEVRPSLPIVLTTGFSDVVTPERAKEAGIRDYLMKPVEKSRLLETFKNILD